MTSCYILTKEYVNSSQLRRFIENRGGYWNPEPTLNQGVLEKGRARIFASVEAPKDSGYQPDELAVIEQILGTPPESVIAIEVGHDKRSPKLAEEFAQDVLNRWPGYFDDNITKLIDPTADQLA